MNSFEGFNNDMHFGIYLCTKGHCELNVNDQWRHISCGDAIVKSPLVQIIGMKTPEEVRFATILQEDIEVLGAVAEGNIDTIQEILRQNKFYFSSTKEEQELLIYRKKQIDDYKKELEVTQNVREYKTTLHIIKLIEQATVLEYIRMFLRHQDIQQVEMERERNVMVKFMFLLFQNYKHHRQVQFYADALCFSSNHFTRIIKKVSRRTPSEWIAIVTINQAKKLLRQNNKSIKEVAEELGFPEQFTFRKYFKQHSGKSPKEYKTSL